MRKGFALLLTMAAVLCTLATANAETIKVTVPFDFVVNGRTLPAATYTIQESLPNNKFALTFLSEGTAGVALAANEDTSVTGTQLVFHRIGDQYFLSDVVSLDGKLHFPVSRREAHLARIANQTPITTSVGN